MLNDREVLGRYSGRRIVVTEGLGFLGDHLIRALSEIDCQIVRVIRPGTISGACVNTARITDVCGDMRDETLWERALPQAEFVFHLAGQTSAAVAASDPARDFEANVLPLLRLLETSRRRGIRPTVLFAGTVTETGIPTCLPVDENHPDNPVTVYDLHKLMAENYLKFYVGDNVVKGVSLRLANVYGPGPNSAHEDRAILNCMIRKALAGEKITIHGPGHLLRDYIYVDDVIEAFLAAGACIDALTGRHFVIGSGQGYTIKEAFTLVAERSALRLGRKVAVEHIAPPGQGFAIDTRNFVANPSSFARTTGWHARYALRDGIDRTIEAYLCAS